MIKLVKTGFQKENVVSYGNMFLIGNGHLGYRGTLEEWDSSNFVGLNVVGFYDRYKKLWRESLNTPNPFYVKIRNSFENCSVFENSPIFHSIQLALNEAVFSRKTEFNSLKISSERFISSTEDNLLCMKYTVIAKHDQKIEIDLGTDLNIWEINGPHYKTKKIKRNQHNLIFVGRTNENKFLKMDNRYCFENFEYTYKDGIFHLIANLKANEQRTIVVFSKIIENCRDFEKINRYNARDYKYLKAQHIESFNKKFENARVIIEGDKNAQFELDYSIYHLLILENENYTHSIPARGVSGQTYKGAIFWDTEIFMQPFYILTNPKNARSLLEYRIKTLSGALEKAKKLGFDGAFYHWESQEGKEMCSKYNVTDVFTNKPVRTYFNEKQIHISADIVYALDNYIKFTGDYSILNEGANNMMKEIYKFFKSYSRYKNGLYHIYDVIGPDEYHERVKDNAFTNYMIDFVCETIIKYLETDEIIEEVKNFKSRLYLPKINNKSFLIEQFKGFFKLEKTTVEEVRSRLRHPNEYWGTKNGVAAKTQIIKQADVVTLLVLLSNKFNLHVKKANYEYYYPITEHGSSLSASMYSLLGCEINKIEDSYKMFRKSSSIDLGTNQKMFAGGIYIGGTHPASNGGAYMSVIYGFCGLKCENNELKFKANFPKTFKRVKFKISFKNKKYLVELTRRNTKIEVIDDEN